MGLNIPELPCASVRNRLRAQPVNATPSILIDESLKPMVFLRRGLALIRGGTSTGEGTRKQRYVRLVPI